MNKACGLNMINHRLLNESAIVISLPLVYIFDKCLNIGKFPTLWKLTNIVPIHTGTQKCLESTTFPVKLPEKKV